jgi:hypothetical protein
MATKELKKQGLTMTYVGNQASEELDFKIRDEILGKKWSDDNIFDYPITIMKNNNGTNWQGHSEPILISSLEKMLAKLKKKGANYVEIMYHTDHYQYIINGLESHKSTPEEIQQYFKTQEEESAKLKAEKIAKLEYELKQLKK